MISQIQFYENQVKKALPSWLVYDIQQNSLRITITSDTLSQEEPISQNLMFLKLKILIMPTDFEGPEISASLALEIVEECIAQGKFSPTLS